MTTKTDLKSLVRTIPHYPKEGIMFRDITTLIKDASGLKTTIDLLVERYKTAKLDAVVGIEARGFILGSALAYALGVGFVPVRKKGKLPGKTISVSYALEYGTDTIELHDDALKAGDNVLVIDDLIATGGTAIGAITLVEKLGAKVFETAFVIDLPELGGADKIRKMGHHVHTIINFDGH